MNEKTAQEKVPPAPVKYIKHSKDQGLQGSREQSNRPQKGINLKIMKKLLNALKGINKFGLALVLFTAITLMSFSATKQKVASTQYGWTGSTWILINDDEYECNQDDMQECKANFLNDPNGPNPQRDPSAPVVYEGLYQPIQR